MMLGEQVSQRCRLRAEFRENTRPQLNSGKAERADVRNRLLVVASPRDRRIAEPHVSRSRGRSMGRGSDQRQRARGGDADLLEKFPS